MRRSWNLASRTAGAVAVALAFAGGNAAAQPHTGYLNSSAGVVKSGTGLCWHTGSWTRDKALPGCDALPRVAAEIPPSPPTPPKPAPAPAPVAEAAPPPAPARVEVPPAPPVITRVALDTELLFDFDSATLRPYGKDKLAELARELHGAKVERIDVTGHADRIGSEAYNDVLSEERARSVAGYLDDLGFDAKLIRVEGRGESEPVTAGKCRGMGPENGDNAKLVACLQPNRRVAIEALGTRAAGAR